MNTYESRERPLKGDPKTIIFDELGGLDVVDKDSIFEVTSATLGYLVTHTELHVTDISCIEAENIRYLFVPAGTPINSEDMSNCDIRVHERNKQGFDIYIEEKPSP